ncbi:MAG: hypothetical protein LBR11_04280, partial [Deltaproteobacteria bacterium]|nr:hypothetical protein [Deltaproteobacteria bacterium]
MSQVTLKSPVVGWALNLAGNRHFKLLIWSWLIILALTLSSGLARAANHNYDGNTRDTFQSNINSSYDGDSITITTNGPITFAAGVPALIINKNNLTIQGNSPTNFGNGVDSLYQKIFNYANTNKNATLNELLNFISPNINNQADIYSTNAKIITSSNPRTVNSLTPSVYEGNKIIHINDNINNFTFNNINFKNIMITYTFPDLTATEVGGGGIVNSFIGNDRANSHYATMGNILDNSFTNLTVEVHGFRDVNYLAGGGIIGLRSTENSTTIGQINGNLFKGIKVTTDQSTNTSAKSSAYIEGGGLIGLDAVSSPSKYKGHAYLQRLSNNLFTDVKIKSDDMILGAGLVGVNNNSQNNDKQAGTNNSLTFAKLDTVYRNVFGNGASNDISVIAGYSLRGGGVIGVNGLSSADTHLTYLYENVFGGINVSVGTYLKGGGIVGLNNNDADKYTYNVNTTIANWAISSNLENIVSNLFYNIDVSAGDGAKQSAGKKGEISGGGIIGVRTGPNAANIGLLVNNIFKNINVSSNGPGAGTGSNILGGGVVGVSSEWWSTLEGAYNNYFENISVKVNEGHLAGDKGHIKGGGVIGLYSGVTHADTKNPLALGSVLTNNVFQAIDVETKIGNIYGGGIIGATAFNGSATPGRSSQAGFTAIGNNYFGDTTKKINVKTNNLTGGGLIGVYSENGSSSIMSIDNNQFASNGIVIAASNITGGGLIGTVIGPHSTNVSSLKYVTNNNFRYQNVTTSGHIIGGGLVGAVALGEGDANILAISSDKDASVFVNNKISIGRYLEGGGLIGVRSGKIASIGTINNIIFSQNEINVGGFIDGGGLIGVTGPAADNGDSNARYGISLIKDTAFENNLVIANGPIAGGLVYSYGLNSPLVIDGSRFEGNGFYSSVTGTDWTGTVPTPTVYGTITIDTGLKRDNKQLYQTNKVTLLARENDQTVFSGNTIGNGTHTWTNSLYFGRVPIMVEDKATGKYKFNEDKAYSDAEL